MSATAENPNSARSWRGHEWNCPQCRNAVARDFDTSGMSIPQLADFCRESGFDGLCDEGRLLKLAAIQFDEAETMMTAASVRAKSAARAEKFQSNDFGEKAQTKAFDPTKYILPETKGQQEFLASMLTGSQPKTAFALRMNCEKMCKEGGINSIGFLTLTVGEYHCKFHGEKIPVQDVDEDGNQTGKKNCCPQCLMPMKFVQVQDAKEASRRIGNLNRRILPLIFEKSITVTERMKSGMIHYHVLGILSGRPDIRRGFDFENFGAARQARNQGWINWPAEKKYKLAASENLRGLWAQLRDVLPGYGFGRAELTPVRKTGEAVSSYISKYIEKNVANRLPEDKHKKLVRYQGWGKAQLKPNDFEWNGEKSKAWRFKTREILQLVYCDLPDKKIIPEKRIVDFCEQAGGKIRPKMLDGSQAKEAFGARWAFHVNRIRSCFDTAESEFTNDFVSFDYLTRSFARLQLIKLAPGWCENREREKLKFSEEMPELRALISQREFVGNFVLQLSGNPAKN